MAATAPDAGKASWRLDARRRWQSGTGRPAPPSNIGWQAGPFPPPPLLPRRQIAGAIMRGPEALTGRSSLPGISPGWTPSTRSRAAGRGRRGARTSAIRASRRRSPGRRGDWHSQGGGELRRPFREFFPATTLVEVLPVVIQAARWALDMDEIVRIRRRVGWSWNPRSSRSPATSRGATTIRK